MELDKCDPKPHLTVEKIQRPDYLKPCGHFSVFYSNVRCTKDTKKKKQPIEQIKVANNKSKILFTIQLYFLALVRYLWTWMDSSVCSVWLICLEEYNY